MVESGSRRTRDGRDRIASFQPTDWFDFPHILSSDTFLTWLKQGKTARVLKGHTAGVTCLCYHPYGDFLISGSKDTNFKLWDVRAKNCLLTYKGHNEEITCARFSPDGAWCATSGKDGVLTLWDLRGKEVRLSYMPC